MSVSLEAWAVLPFLSKSLGNLWKEARYRLLKAQGADNTPLCWEVDPLWYSCRMIQSPSLTSVVAFLQTSPWSILAWRSTRSRSSALCSDLCTDGVGYQLFHSCLDRSQLGAILWKVQRAFEFRARSGKHLPRRMLWCLIHSDGKQWQPDRNRATHTRIGCSSYNCEASCRIRCLNLKVPADSRSSNNWTSYLLRLETHRNRLPGTYVLSLTWARHC